MKGRKNLQETTAPFLTKMEVKEELRSNEGQLWMIWIYRVSVMYF